MKIKKMKKKLGLGKRWSGMRIEEEYIFEYINISIGVKLKDYNYEISISSQDGYIKREFQNLEETKEFINNKLEV